MTEKDKIINLGGQINKKDLETILEVNKKAVEIETEVASQNEEIIKLLNNSAENQNETNTLLDKILNDKLDKIIKQNEETSRDIFVMKVLYITGLLTLVGQIVQVFLRK